MACGFKLSCAGRLGSWENIGGVCTVPSYSHLLLLAKPGEEYLQFDLVCSERLRFEEQFVPKKRLIGTMVDLKLKLKNDDKKNEIYIMGKADHVM